MLVGWLLLMMILFLLSVALWFYERRGSKTFVLFCFVFVWDCCDDLSVGCSCSAMVDDGCWFSNRIQERNKVQESNAS